MSLRVYNTLTKQKDLFEPVRPGKVGIYLCGPTVYKSPHIGHMVGPVIFDAVKRYLKFKGYEVTWVVNITDVDDKLIEAAARLDTTVEALAAKHTKGYFEALAALGVDGIDHFPKATDHIPDIIQICKNLISTGHAYDVEGNVWFDVARDADYGKLSHRKVEDQEAGTRDLEAGGKRSPADFALWKSAKPGEPMWDSPWGKGRPGWHIECSAMSMKILGPSFDIHGGGMDLMFPHHENELAQSESATGQTFVKYWLHNGLTKIRTKSGRGEGPEQAVDIHETSGNAAQVRALDLIAKHGPEVIRYLLLSSHYRSPIEFSDPAMAAAKKASAVFSRLFERIDRILGEPMNDATTDMDRIAAPLLESDHASYAKNVLGLKLKFLEMMDDDFNTAGAIGALHEMAGEINAFIERNDLDRSKHDDLADAAAAGVQTLRQLGQVLGLFQRRPDALPVGDALPGQLMDLMIRLRQDARAKKNFELADAIRKGLTEIGITIEDGPQGTRWRKD
jgi:cysteinyl-tRNA synthetase